MPALWGFSTFKEHEICFYNFISGTGSALRPTIADFEYTTTTPQSQGLGEDRQHESTLPEISEPTMEGFN
jgi:hypothetical protein